MRIDVLGIGFDNVTLEEAVAAGMHLLRGETASYVVTPNPEIVEICRQNSEACEAVGGAALVRHRCGERCCDSGDTSEEQSAGN